MTTRIFLLLCLLVCSYSLTAQFAVGVNPPDIQLKNQNDSVVSLHSLKGKVVIIDFWATWCGPCRLANKTLKKLYNKYQSQGLEIFSISNDYTTTDWKRGIKADKINWLQVFDEGGKISNAWRIGYLPFTFVLDKTGKIVAADVEARNLEKEIKKLL
jgi:peroxiredoxin